MNFQDICKNIFRFFKKNNHTEENPTKKQNNTNNIDTSSISTDIISSNRKTSNDLTSSDIDFNSYFKDLKKTLLGRDTIFLVNDTNNEIRQHYDKSYVGHIDYNKFIKSQRQKKHYFNKQAMNYAFFAIPDKSILQKNRLPFKTNTPYRHVDKLGEVVYDLKDVVDETDCDITDSHIKRTAGPKINAYILSKFHDKSYEYYLEKIYEKIKIYHVEKYKGDLMSQKNWSYGEGELKDKYYYVPTDAVNLVNEYETLIDEAPEEFKLYKKRPSLYFRNNQSISNKKLLLLSDSYAERLFHSFIAYYREVFAYWDHWDFNEDVVKWYNPDDVVELRGERFLDNPLYFSDMYHEEI